MTGSDRGGLLGAIAAGDLGGIRNAVAAGESVNAKNGYAATPLHAAAMNPDIDDQTRRDVMLLLVELGADIFAENADDSSPLSYLSADDARLVTAAYAGPAPDSSFRIVRAGGETRACVLGPITGFERGALLRTGVPLAAEWPRGVCCVIRSDFPGHRRHTRLCDYHESQQGVPIISTRLRSFLDRAGVSGVEYLRIRLVAGRGKPSSTDYYALNPMAHDCLDRAASEPTFSPVDEGSILDVNRLVIDPARLGPGVSLFRIAGYPEPVVIRRALATAIAMGGYTNITLRLPRR